MCVCVRVCVRLDSVFACLLLSCAPPVLGVCLLFSVRLLIGVGVSAYCCRRVCSLPSLCLLTLACVSCLFFGNKNGMVVRTYRSFLFSACFDVFVCPVLRLCLHSTPTHVLCLRLPASAYSWVQATVLWRQESGANDALATPHPRFDLIKKHYPTYFHGKVKAPSIRFESINRFG